MDGIVTWALAGFGVLLLVAIAVALAEHLTRQDLLSQPAVAGAAPRPAVPVDVPLDALVAAPGTAAASEAASRRDMLDGVLGRMAHRGGGVTDSRRGWVDTAPMIGLGLAAETSPGKASVSAPADTR